MTSKKTKLFDEVNVGEALPEQGCADYRSTDYGRRDCNARLLSPGITTWKPRASWVRRMSS